MLELEVTNPGMGVASCKMKIDTKAVNKYLLF